MFTYIKLTLLFGASLLSACNVSSEYVGVSAGEEATRLFSDSSGSVGTALTDGKTVTARSVSIAGLTRNYDTGDGGLIDTVVAIKKNDAGELTMIVDGVEYAFSNEDRREDRDDRYRVEDDENNVYVDLSIWSQSIDELITGGERYSDVIRLKSTR